MYRGLPCSCATCRKAQKTALKRRAPDQVAQAANSTHRQGNASRDQQYADCGEHFLTRHREMHAVTQPESRQHEGKKHCKCQKAVRKYEPCNTNTNSLIS